MTDLAQLEHAVAPMPPPQGKLWQAGLGTAPITVFPREHDRNNPQHLAALTFDLPKVTSDTVLLTKAARWGARPFWRNGFAYSKAGLITDDHVPLGGRQRALPGIGQFDSVHNGALMAALDSCYARWGRGTDVLAAAGFQKSRTWSTKFEMRSPRYTTSFSDVPVIC